MIQKVEAIYEVLKKDERLLSTEGDLLKNKIYELAMKMDSGLIKLLASDVNTKDVFFTDIDGILVFDKVKFGWVIDSKDFLPDSYTAFKNDIMLMDEQGNSISGSNNVVLSFPFKDCIIEVDSTETDEKREEVFFNEILAKSDIDTLLAPKVITNGVKHSKDKKENVVEITNDDNLLIKGNNLVAINSLLPRYEGQIKLMYWDILYNTDNDLVPYNDSFKHSSWLVMMKNRLTDAKKLLAEDGLIYVQLDDNEVAYLTVLMDEVFDRSNRVNIITVKSSEASGVKITHADKKFPKIKDFILVYRKTESARINPIKIPKLEWDSEYNKVLLNFSKDDKEYLNSLISKDIITDDDVATIDSIFSRVEVSTIINEMKKEAINTSNQNDTIKWLNENAYRIFRTAASKSVYELTKEKMKYIDQVFFTVLSRRDKKLYVVKSDFTEDSKSPRVQLLFAEDYLTTYLGDIWTNIPTTGLEFEGSVELKNGKKPELLIKNIIESATNKNDLVLDAYFGSGTTGAVALKTGRKFIGIEQLDNHFDLAIERLTNVVNGDQSGISKELDWTGGGSFVTVELKSLSNQIINRIRTSNEDELTAIYREISESPFLNYKAEIYKLKETATAFESLTEDEKRRILIELIDKNTLYINYADMDDVSYEVTDEEKALTTSFYTK